MKKLYGFACLAITVAASGFEATTYRYIPQTETARMLSPSGLPQFNARVTNLNDVAVPSPDQLLVQERIRADDKVADAATLPIRVTRVRLTCPLIPAGKWKTRVASPIDEKKGDCGLVGKGVEIEKYLRSLENLAAECNARIEESWSNVQKAKANLDTEIDALPGETPSFAAASPCMRTAPMEPAASIGHGGDPYTSWLKRIGKDTVKFCRLVDELIRPLKKSCDAANEEIRCLIESNQWVNDSTRASLHGRLAASMNSATINHDSLYDYYNNTLKVLGWGDFRKNFNESTLKCPNQAPRGRKGRKSE